MPALCAGALAVLAALQFALTTHPEPPPPSWSGGGTHAAMPRIAGRAAPEALLRGSIFAPTRTLQAQGTEGAPSPLGGAAVAGAVTVRGRSYAVIQRADGQVVRLPVGGRIEGMRLVALSPEGAVFQSGGQRSHIAFGTAVRAAEPEPEAEEGTE